MAGFLHSSVFETTERRTVSTAGGQLCTNGSSNRATMQSPVVIWLEEIRYQGLSGDNFGCFLQTKIFSGRPENESGYRK